MGDTGSLALGGVMGAVAILTHRELTLLVVAGVFVIETLSVILQVFWLRFFHKKLFLMTLYIIILKNLVGKKLILLNYL